MGLQNLPTEIRGQLRLVDEDVQCEPCYFLWTDRSILFIEAISLDSQVKASMKNIIIFIYATKLIDSPLFLSDVP